MWRETNLKLLSGQLEDAKMEKLVGEWKEVSRSLDEFS